MLLSESLPRSSGSSSCLSLHFPFQPHLLPGSPPFLLGSLGRSTVSLAIPLSWLPPHTPVSGQSLHLVSIKNSSALGPSIPESPLSSHHDISFSTPFTDLPPFVWTLTLPRISGLASALPSFLPAPLIQDPCLQFAPTVNEANLPSLQVPLSCPSLVSLPPPLFFKFPNSPSFHLMPGPVARFLLSFQAPLKYHLLA